MIKEPDITFKEEIWDLLIIHAKKVADPSAVETVLQKPREY